MKFDSLCSIIEEAVYGEPSLIYDQPKNSDSEYIVAAAVKDPVTNDIYLGDYHDMALINAVNNAGARGEHFDRGFFTNKDRFVDRKEAMQIAKQGRQIDPNSKYSQLTSADFVEFER
jgi:hypothetical protein